MPTWVSVVTRHTNSLALVRVDRNKKSIPVGVREGVSSHIRTVLQRAVQFEAVVVLSSEGI
jgi:hypothetical protein